MSIPNRMLTLREVTELTGLGRSKIYEAMSDGEFPKSVRPDQRAARWYEEEIRAWIVQRPRYGE